MIAADAVLTETREKIEAPTVSALQQAHEIEVTALRRQQRSFFLAHKDMTVTSKEQARQKQLDILESMKVFKKVVRGRVACWNTRHVRLLGRHG